MTFVEDETTAMFDTFLTGLSMAAEEQREYVQKLKNGSRVDLLREPEELQMVDDTEVPEEEPREDPERAETECRIDGRKIANDARTSILGGDPRSRREKIRAGLPDGFYIWVSGIRSVRTPHSLGSCYLLSDVDYWRYSMKVQTCIPQALSTTFARSVLQGKGVGKSTYSSASQDSSSTSEGEPP